MGWPGMATHAQKNTKYYYTSLFENDGCIKSIAFMVMGLLLFFLE